MLNFVSSQLTAYLAASSMILSYDKRTEFYDYYIASQYLIRKCISSTEEFYVPTPLLNLCDNLRPQTCLGIPLQYGTFNIIDPVPTSFTDVCNPCTTSYDSNNEAAALNWISSQENQTLSQYRQGYCDGFSNIGQDFELHRYSAHTHLSRYPLASSSSVAGLIAAEVPLPGALFGIDITTTTWFVPISLFDSAFLTEYARFCWKDMIPDAFSLRAKECVYRQYSSGKNQRIPEIQKFGCGWMRQRYNGRDVLFYSDNCAYNTYGGNDIGVPNESWEYFAPANFRWYDSSAGIAKCLGNYTFTITTDDAATSLYFDFSDVDYCHNLYNVQEYVLPPTSLSTAHGGASSYVTYGIVFACIVVLVFVILYIAWYFRKQIRRIRYDMLPG